MDLEEDNSFQFSELQRSATNHARSSDHQTTMEEPDRKRANNSPASIDLGRFYNWPSSRIVRVPRASAGKDRHSKVVTSKGQLRDRRVRLSVNTAIQFYDLQDRLGYDQPSKAVEWLLKAAESSISELPPITDAAFTDTPPECRQKRSGSPATNGVVSDQLTLEDLDRPVAGGEVGGCNNYLQQRAGNKSCSSASNETTTTSKGSGLSLSRSEIRGKARERAKERVAEKEKETTSRHIAAGCSFTELLSSGMDSSNNDGSPNSGSGGAALKSPGNNWSSSSSTATATTTAAMDYFTANMALQMQLASNPITMAAHPMFGENGELLQQFSFVPDHMVVHAANSSNNSHDDQQNGTLNFTISSFNGGTLQSNFSSSSSSSSMLWPSLHLPQRFPNIDVISPQSFVITPMDNNNNNNNVNHHGQQFLSGYDAAKLQLCYGNPNLHGMHSKGKGKH